MLTICGCRPKTLAYLSALTGGTHADEALGKLNRGDSSPGRNIQRKCWSQGRETEAAAAPAVRAPTCEAVERGHGGLLKGLSRAPRGNGAQGESPKKKILRQQ